MGRTTKMIWFELHLSRMKNTAFDRIYHSRLWRLIMASILIYFTPKLPVFTRRT